MLECLFGSSFGCKKPKTCTDGSTYYNVPKFGPTIYRHEPIDHDDYIDVLFLYWVKYPTAYEHDDFLCILGISQLLMIYMYIYIGCVGC